MSDQRRLYGFVVSGQIIGAMARHGKRTIEVSSPVPESATFFTAYFDHARNAFVCIFEDASFDPVAEGGLIPVGIGPTITRCGDDRRIAGVSSETSANRPARIADDDIA